MKVFYVRFIRRVSTGEANHSSFQTALSPLGALRNAVGAHCDDFGYDSSNAIDFDIIAASLIDVMITEVRDSTGVDHT